MLLCPRDPPGKNTGVGYHFLLQSIFLTQGLNPCLLCLLRCRWILYYWIIKEAFITVLIFSKKYPHLLSCLFIGKNIVDGWKCTHLKVFIYIKKHCCSVATSCSNSFRIPWTAACQVFLSFTISQSLLKLMSTELGWHPTISPSAALFSFGIQSFPASGSFLMSQLLTSGGQSIGALALSSVFQRISRVDFL